MNNDGLQEKIIYAYMRSCHWLAKSNAASERGDHKQAAKHESKAQYWLDRLNKLEGKA